MAIGTCWVGDAFVVLVWSSLFTVVDSFCYPGCDLDQICCSNECCYESSCLGLYCNFDSDWSSGESCCQNLCVNGSSCQGQSCWSNSDCSVDENCCNEKCEDGSGCIGHSCFEDSGIAEAKKTVVTRHANMTAPASRFSQLAQLLVPFSFFL